MKIKKVIIAALSAANVLSVTSWLILTAAGSSIANKQGYNKAAEIWDPDGGYTQISCFLTEDSGFTTDTVRGIKTSLLSDLKNSSIVPEEGKELIPEAYSTSAGQMTVKSDLTTGRSEAQITAVGGDFFRFRDFDLLDGSYFTDSDIMQDGAVIDRELAWSLYGSSNVAGMYIYINGTKFYIAGVIEDPLTEKKETEDKDDKEQTSPVKEEYPRAYISYTGANLISGSTASMDMKDDITDTALKKISCYECLVPDPVEGYAYEMVRKLFEETYNGKVINNSTRFSPSVRAKAFKNLSDYAVAEDGIIYPYWENASRVAEFKLSSIYFFRRLTYIIPALTALLLIIILWKAAGRLRRKLTSKAGDSVTRVIYNHNQKQKQKKEIKENDIRKGNVS